jgi:hypothetical protein
VGQTAAPIALERAIRGPIADTSLTALVPANAIFDRHGRPAVFPHVILGEDQEMLGDISWARDHVRVFSTLHVWQRELGLTGIKAIAGAIRKALDSKPSILVSTRCVDLRFERMRSSCDQGSETGAWGRERMWCGRR